MSGCDTEAASMKLDERIARQQACIAEIEARTRDACLDAVLDRHRRIKALHEKHKALVTKAAALL